jgi:hypothetical protein
MLTDRFPFALNLGFILTALLTGWLFLRATKNSRSTLFIFIIWLSAQALISLSGFYYRSFDFPPRILFLVFPALLMILGLFITGKGRKYLDGLSLSQLSLVHVMRIPVELVLYLLFLKKAVPQLMTFAGMNFDILAGLTAPIIYYFGGVRKQLSRAFLLIWNILGLGLLLNIIAIAVFSLPYPFQRFAFDQPNMAVLYFPFAWLPGFVVPLVLVSHLAAIRQLVRDTGKP